MTKKTEEQTKHDPKKKIIKTEPLSLKDGQQILTEDK